MLQAIKKDGDFPRFFFAFFLAEVQKTKNTDKRFLFFFAKINSITKDFFFLWIHSGYKKYFSFLYGTILVKEKRIKFYVSKIVPWTKYFFFLLFKLRLGQKISFFLWEENGFEKRNEFCAVNALEKRREKMRL